MRHLKTYPYVAICITVLVGLSLIYDKAKYLSASAIPAASLESGSSAKSEDSSSSMVPVPDAPLTEGFSFVIRNFKMDHQGEIRHLTITVSYEYASGIRDSDYPDYQLLEGDVKRFLSRYPNKVDYWEIVNKHLTSMLLSKYPVLSKLKSEIEVSPSRLLPLSRKSVVTRSRVDSAVPPRQ